MTTGATERASYGGLRPTGRQTREPCATVLELESEDGFAHLGIAFEPSFRGHSVLDVNVRLVLPFLEFPMVAGLTDLAWYDLTNSIFVYPTGTVWLLHEVLRAWHDEGRRLGTRAALEVMLLTTEITREGSATGGLQGCYSHGNLSPWRIALREDGTVQVIGYGLSQVEIALRRADPKYPLSAESLRYCPPERLTGQAEDAAADSLSLALIACEMMTGKPLYQAPAIADVERMVSLSDGTNLLARPPAEIPKALAETLARALVYDPETRLSGTELLDELEGHLAKASGPSLAEVMTEVAAKKPQGERPRKKLQAATATSVFERGSLAQMADDDDDDDAIAEKPKGDARWGSPTRRSSAAEPAPPASAPVAPEGRRLRREGEAPAGEVRRRLQAEPPVSPPAESPPEVAEGEPRRRLRRITDEPAGVPDAMSAPTDSPGDGVRRRLRRLTDEPPAAPAAPAPPTEAAPTVEGDEPRRRLLRREDAAAPGEGAEPLLRRRLRREEP